MFRRKVLAPSSKKKHIQINTVADCLFLSVILNPCTLPIYNRTIPFPLIIALSRQTQFTYPEGTGTVSCTLKFVHNFYFLVNYSVIRRIQPGRQELDAASFNPEDGSNELCRNDVTFQNTIISTLTAVITSNLTQSFTVIALIQSVSLYRCPEQRR